MATVSDAEGSISDTDSVSVILPAYNEGRNLTDLIPEVVDVCESSGRPYEVLVVDDGSQDDTAEIATQAASLYNNVKAVLLDANFGQSAALKAGFDRSCGDIIIPMDADGQNDPADIPLLISELKSGADCVSGWRQDRDDPLSKRIPSAIQTRLAMLTGPDIHDFGCTLSAYRSNALSDIDLRGERHRYLPAQLHQRGYDVTEVEVDHHAREHGESHYGLGRLMRGFVDLVYHLFRVRYRARPMHIFGSVGLLSFASGAFIGLLLLYQRYVLASPLNESIPKLLLGVTLSLFGFGLFALGLITELLTEVIYADVRPYRISEVVE